MCKYNLPYEAPYHTHEKKMCTVFCATLFLMSTQFLPPRHAGDITQCHNLLWLVLLVPLWSCYNIELYLYVQSQEQTQVTFKLLYFQITQYSVYLLDSQHMIAQSSMEMTQRTITYTTSTVLWLVVGSFLRQSWQETQLSTLYPQPLGLWLWGSMDLSPPALQKTLWCQI